MPTVVYAVSALLVCLLAMSSQAAAQDKELDILPNYTTPAVEFRITINKPMVAIGKAVAFSFTSTQDGYVTLWDIGTSGRVTRLYPNRYGGTMRVRAGQRYGAGGPGDSFMLRATRPLGMEDVYALWTRTPDSQPTADRYDNAAALRHALQAVERLPARDWATAKVAFSIVQPDTQAPSHAPGAASLLISNTRTAYLFAMGANVGELKRSMRGR